MEITAEVCEYLIRTYSHGMSNDFVYLAPLARAWLGHVELVVALTDRCIDLQEQLASEKRELEAQVTTLTQINECERQSTRDVLEVMEESDRHGEELEQQMAAQQTEIERLQHKLYIAVQGKAGKL